MGAKIRLVHGYVAHELEVLQLRQEVAGLPRIASYLASPRRLPFGEDGIFRRYPELDDPPAA